MTTMSLEQSCGLHVWHKKHHAGMLNQHSQGGRPACSTLPPPLMIQPLAPAGSLAPLLKLPAWGLEVPVPPLRQTWHSSHPPQNWPGLASNHAHQPHLPLTEPSPGHQSSAGCGRP